MARKRHSDEDGLKILREVEVHLSSGMDVQSACRTAGIRVWTYKRLSVVMDSWTKSLLS